MDLLLSLAQQKIRSRLDCPFLEITYNTYYLSSSSIHYLHSIISFGDLSSKNDTKGHKNISKESNYKRGNIIIIPQNVLDHGD